MSYINLEIYIKVQFNAIHDITDFNFLFIFMSIIYFKEINAEITMTGVYHAGAQ